MNPIAQQFIHALHHLEQKSDPQPLLELFSDDCVVGNVVTGEEFRGREAAERFWDDYRSTFEHLTSEFRNVVESDGAIALEWKSVGRAKGQLVEYDGVSILELKDGKVRRFHGYFDSRSLAHIVRDASQPAVSTPSAAQESGSQAVESRTAVGSQTEDAPPRKPAQSESEDFTPGRDRAHPGGYG